MAEPPEPTKPLNDAYHGGSFVNETPLASATQAHQRVSFVCRGMCARSTAFILYETSTFVGVFIFVIHYRKGCLRE